MSSDISDADDWYIVDHSGELRFANEVKVEEDKIESEDGSVVDVVNDEVTEPVAADADSTVPANLPEMTNTEELAENKDDDVDEDVKLNASEMPIGLPEQISEIHSQYFSPEADANEAAGAIPDVEAFNKPLERNSSSSDISLVEDQDPLKVPSMPRYRIQHVATYRAVNFVEREGSVPREVKTRHKGSQTHKRRRHSQRPEELPRFPTTDPLVRVPSLLIFTAALLVSLIFTMHSPPDEPKEVDLTLVEHMEKIHRFILSCLGQQQLEVLQSDDVQKKLYLVCENEREEYRKQIASHYNDEVRFFLSTSQEILHRNETIDLKKLLKTNLTLPDIEIIILQLQHYEILPNLLDRPLFQYLEQDDLSLHVDADMVLSQFQEAAKNLTLLNEELRNLISSNGHKNAESNEQSAWKKEESDKSKITKEFEALLEEKMKGLHLHYEALELAIEDLRRQAEERPEVESGRPNGNYISSEEQIQLLQVLQENTYLQVKHLYDFLMKNGAPNFNDGMFYDGTKDYWSLNNLKESVKGYIWEAHNDLKETVNDYRNDVSEVLSSFMEDGKKHAEDTLNILTEFFKIAKKGTGKILNEKFSESVVNGVWNVWGSLQNKWKDVKKEIDVMANSALGKSQKADKEEPPIGPHDGNLRGDNIGKPNRPNDWLFHRAAVREMKRESGGPINWFLSREKLREKQRKWDANKKNG